VKIFANSINVTNSFNGNKSETWQFRRIDSVKTVNTVSYDKTFSPLLCLSFNWKKGISSTMGYNFTQRVEENHSMNSKTRNINESMTFQTNYTSRKGFRIPIPIWPFKNRRFKNSTSFALNYQFSRDRRETSNNDEDFSDPTTSTSWSVSPSIDYSFSSTVKGGFDYEYGIRRTQQQGKVSSQEFSFRVNISIRG
jgi:cell surface protein SprA